MNGAKHSVSAIIPAYNEEKAILETIDGLKSVLRENAADFEIIVVNDGSTDLTAKALEERKDITVITHPVNRGYGRSLLSGIEKARHDWILMIDADGSYPSEEIDKLIPFLNDFDMVIGSRQGAIFWGSRSRTLTRWIYLNLARFVAGEKIPDANSGLRMFRKSLLETSMPVVCYGYSFSTTMTLSFIQSGKFVKFVPVLFERTAKIKKEDEFIRVLQAIILVLIHRLPLKLFAPLSLAVLILSAARFSAILFLASVALFSTGCVLEILTRRAEHF